MLHMTVTEKQGMTLLELLVCTVIIGILSATALPIAKNVVRHQKEVLLRERLAELRKAIDRFYEKKSTIEPGLSDIEYYPSSLEELVEKRFIRKIPVDPFTLSPDWITRSSTDLAETEISDMANVFDVFSATAESDRNNQPYRNW